MAAMTFILGPEVSAHLDRSFSDDDDNDISEEFQAVRRPQHDDAGKESACRNIDHQRLLFGDKSRSSPSAEGRDEAVQGTCNSIFDLVSSSGADNAHTLLASALSALFGVVGGRMIPSDFPPEFIGSVPMSSSSLKALLLAIGVSVLVAICVLISRITPESDYMKSAAADAQNKQSSHIDDAANNELLDVYQQCRIRVQRALGSVHEFSVPPSTGNCGTLDSDGIYGAIRNAEQYATFAETNAELLQRIDNSMRVIRIGAGLHLGIGPASKAVCRVENSVVGREYRKLQKLRRKESTSAISRAQMEQAPSPLGLNRAREILYCVMREHWELLCTLLYSLEGDKARYSGSIDSYPAYHSSGQPLTLSLLVSMRKDLGELFYEFISRGLVNVETSRNILPVDVLQASVHTAKEKAEYLRSCFPDYSEDGEADTLSASSRRSSCGDATSAIPKSIQLGVIHRRIDAVAVSLWAFEESVRCRNDKGEGDDEASEWWLRTRDMLLEAVAYWHELDLYLTSNGYVKSRREDQEKHVKQDDSGEDMRRRSNTTGTYEVGADKAYLQNVSNIDPHPEGRTVIFSGKASRRRPEMRERHPQLQDIPHRTDLFSELQNRINSIELADEWDAYPDEESSIDSDSDCLQDSVNKDHHSGATKALPFAIAGASGSLFEELKSTIRNACGDEMVLGD